MSSEEDCQQVEIVKEKKRAVKRKLNFTVKEQEMKAKINQSDIIMKILKKMSHSDLLTLVFEEHLTDCLLLHTHMTGILLDYETAYVDCSEEEQLNWFKIKQEELLSTMECLNLDQIENYKVAIQNLLKTQVANSNSSLNTAARTYTQSTIAPLAMGHAGASLDSFFTEKQLIELNSSAKIKKSSVGLSNITFRKNGNSVFHRLEQPASVPNFQLKMSLFNLDEMKAMNVPPAEEWKAAAMSLVYYGTTNPSSSQYGKDSRLFEIFTTASRMAAENIKQQIEKEKTIQENGLM